MEEGNPSDHGDLAAALSAPGHDSDAEPGQDPRLDVTSPQFDAQLALQTPDLQLPVPDAPTLDNISKCAAFVQPEQQQPKQTHQDDPAALREAQAKKAKAVACKQRALQAAQRAEASVRLGSLKDIMSIAAVGPLAALAKWHAAGQRVYVVTRHASGVRGRAVGTIVAFDKYLNLLLRDVEEAYTVIVKVQRVKQQAVGPQHGTAAGPQQQLGQQQQQERQLGQQQQQQQREQQQEQQGQEQQLGHQQQEQPQQQVPAAATRTRTRWCRKQQHRYRQLDQILLRGDNIVLVSGTPPATLQLQPPA